MRTYLNLARCLLGRRIPIYAHVEVTHRCNLRCRMCNIWREADRGSEASVKRVGEIADVLRKLGAISVSIGGAEPFLRDDLPEVVAALKRRGLMVRVLTNAYSLSDEQIQRVAAAGLDEVSVSLDTLDPDMQAQICNAPDIWPRVVRNLCALSAALPRRGSVLLINCVVSHVNVDELPRLVEFADAIGYYISFVPVHLAAQDGEHDRFERCAPEMGITPEQRRELAHAYERLIALKRRGAAIINSTTFLRQSSQFLLDRGQYWRCDAGSLYFSIDPRGWFAICHDYEGRRDYSAEEVLELFRSPAFARERDRLIAQCGTCMRPCWAEVTHLVHDWRALLEMLRVRLAVTRPRRLVSYEDALAAAERLRGRSGQRATHH